MSKNEQAWINAALESKTEIETLRAQLAEAQQREARMREALVMCGKYFSEFAHLGDHPIDYKEEFELSVRVEEVLSGEPAPGEPAPGEPAPGEPAPGDPAPGEPAPGDPAPDPRDAVVDAARLLSRRHSTACQKYTTSRNERDGERFGQCNCGIDRLEKALEALDDGD